MLEMTLRDEKDQFVQALLFTRSEIRMRTCSDCWDVWHVATESSCPHMFSYRVKSISSSDFENNHLPNEVRSYNWSSDDQF